MSAEYQPYFTAYARSQGMEPEAIILTRPGLWKLDFLSWMRARWSEYRKQIGVGPDDVLTAEQREAFQYWLDGRTA